eukprot:scaffold113872_cov35-Tisochrysis_lutea.AAC.4
MSHRDLGALGLILGTHPTCTALPPNYASCRARQALSHSPSRSTRGCNDAAWPTQSASKSSKYA